MITTLQVALVWREGDDEEGVVTYEELELSVRKVSRALQQVTKIFIAHCLRYLVLAFIINKLNHFCGLALTSNAFYSSRFCCL